MDQESQESSANVKVFARFRPFIEREEQEEEEEDMSFVRFLNNQAIEILSNSQIYTFDHVFPPSADQSQVYALVGQPTIESVLNGINGTIFAYG